MAVRKKVSRKQLLKEPDEFLTVSARLFQFVVKRKYQMLAALGGVILIALIVSGWNYHSQQRTDESLAQLQEIWTRYEELRSDKGSDPLQAYREVESEFERLIEDYGDKTGGKMARVIFAHVCSDAGETDKAIALYQRALADYPHPFYRHQILNGLGYAHEAKKEYEKAVAYFEEIVDGQSDAVLKATALFNMGRLYAALGNGEKSRQAYQKIVTDSPQSLYAELAKERIGRAAAEAPNPAVSSN